MLNLRSFAESTTQLVTYADALVGRQLGVSMLLGLREDTLIILWGDHGWHLGEHAIWGKHALFEESLRSPLIISHPEIRKLVHHSSIVETLDIFPTICDLAGLEVPEYLQGVSLRPILEDPTASGHSAISYTGGAKTIRTSQHRLIAHRNGHLELYDHSSPEGETSILQNQTRPKLPSLLEKLSNRLGQ